jgi:hypothetical protein
MDRELTEILDRHQQVRGDAIDIRNYLLQVLALNPNNSGFRELGKLQKSKPLE